MIKLTDLRTNHTLQLMIAWWALTACLLIFVALLVDTNTSLRDELAKPVPITLQQEHEVIKAYLADGETRYALRQQIGCKDTP